MAQRAVAFFARLPREIHRQHEKACQRNRDGARDGREPAEPPALRFEVALLELIEPDAENAGDDLETRVFFAVTLGARVGRNRFDAPIRQLSVLAETKPQCRRETLVG